MKLNVLVVCDVDVCGQNRVVNRPVSDRPCLAIVKEYESLVVS